jgi:hypothetical protein
LRIGEGGNMKGWEKRGKKEKISKEKNREANKNINKRGKSEKENGELTNQKERRTRTRWLPR